MSSENPYQASLVEAGHSHPDEQVSAREVFLAWEKLRLIYNGVLIAVSLACLLPDISRAENVELLFGGAVAANILYCLGPVGEGYAALFGIARRGARLAIFVLGTLMASLLAAFAILVWA